MKVVLPTESRPSPLLDSTSSSDRSRPQRGFTLIEVLLVLMVMGAVLAIAVVRLGTLNFWKEESAIKKLSENMVFLHNQAIMDQSFYRVEFDLENRNYRVGVMRSDESAATAVAGAGAGATYLTLELAALLSPSLDSESTMIPPPSFPSLAIPTELPGELMIEDIVTPRGKVRRDDNDEEKPYLLFSPRGFSEFGVIHLKTGDNKPVTVLVNPWTGLAEVYREYKEFQWTLGKTKDQ